MMRVAKSQSGQSACRRTGPAQKRRPSPRLVTGVVACGLGLLLVFGRDLRRFFTGHFQPRITFAEGQTRQSAAAAKPKIATPAAVFEGEVARTEVRLREASAVAVAASLTGVAAFVDGRPVREKCEACFSFPDCWYKYAYEVTKLHKINALTQNHLQTK